MTKPSLCLNMIVKNEAARIERCLRSVLPYVKFVAILDTGSTDDTKAIIKRVCFEHDVRALIADGEFEDFSQARNEAFRFAQAVNLESVWCQFALLMDADMELTVAKPTAFDNLDANALSYDMMQKGGAVSYANRRLVNLNWGRAPYVGVTHEYIDVDSAGMLTGALFVDHADGANRVNKFERDAALLEAALKLEPKNGRYRYYLGNTYRDWGASVPTVLPFAADAYEERIAMGGWDEETHSAMMNLASVQKDRGLTAGFVAGMVAAYNFRPSRAEPLYDLAKYYREKGDNAASLIFAMAGIKLKRPNDLLFVNDYVYDHGLRYEYSIVGSYDEKERARAAEVTDDLALDPTCPADIRSSARSNLYWHTKPLGAYCGSFRATKLDFTPPAGYVAMNPSVEECNGKIKCNIRCVNYTINEHGQYMIGDKGCNDAPIDTRNFIARLDVDLKVKDVGEVLWNREAPVFNLVTGLEDIRLYRWLGDLWFSATVRERSMMGTCQQARGKLKPWPSPDNVVEYHVVDFEVLSGDDTHEKNWMPMPSRPYSHQRWMYRLDTIVEPGAALTAREKIPANIHVGDISGGSQLIPFKGGLLAVVHEASNGPDGQRTYWHRFAWFEKDGHRPRLSLPFVFLDKQIEFCAGIAAHPDHNNLILSFGVRDREAYVATVSIEEVAMLCWRHHEA